jgi:hypothetical protein
MYGFDNNTKSESTSLSFNAGIIEDVELESVAFTSPKKDGSGDPVLMFNFKGSNGETFRHIEWAVDMTREDAAKKLESMGKRVKHIVTKFIPEDKATLSGNSYAEFGNGVVNLVGSKNKGIKLRIKLVYKDNGNLAFTPYTGFIERMDANPTTKLRIGKDEKVVKPNPQPTNMAITTPSEADF